MYKFNIKDETYYACCYTEMKNIISEAMNRKHDAPDSIVLIESEDHIQVFGEYEGEFILIETVGFTHIDKEVINIQRTCLVITSNPNHDIAPFYIKWVFGDMILDSDWFSTDSINNKYSWVSFIDNYLNII